MLIDSKACRLTHPSYRAGIILPRYESVLSVRKAGRIASRDGAPFGAESFSTRYQLIELGGIPTRFGEEIKAAAIPFFEES